MLKGKYKDNNSSSCSKEAKLRNVKPIRKIHFDCCCCFFLFGVPIMSAVFQPYKGLTGGNNI